MSPYTDWQDVHNEGYAYLIRPMAVLEPVPTTTALALPAVTTVPCRENSCGEHVKLYKTGALDSGLCMPGFVLGVTVCTARLLCCIHTVLHWHETFRRSQDRDRHAMIR